LWKGFAVTERLDNPEENDFEGFWEDEIDEVDQQIECPDCKGQGGFVVTEDHRTDYEVCLRCGGEGVVFE
jgi:DnaJ-class molecular chaperone